MKLFLYFRLIVSGGLANPIAWAGIVTLAAHRDTQSAWICLLSLICSYSFRNGILFWRGAANKLKVDRFLKQIKGCVLIRIPGMDLAKYFDLSFLIPSYIRPDRLLRYFARNRLNIFLVKRGTSAPPFSPCAFVSPISQDVYIFLRDGVEELSAIDRFKLTHELGHAAGIIQAVTQRNAIGLKCVYFSILWVILSVRPKQWEIGWGLLQLFLAVIVIRPIFNHWRRREPLNKELVADYMALRHLPPDEVQDMVRLGEAAGLIRTAQGSDLAKTEERRAILAAQFERLARGEQIDIPEVYMKETFSHPIRLQIFLVLQMSYIATACFILPSSTIAPFALCIACLLFILPAAIADAQLRITLLRATEPHSL